MKILLINQAFWPDVAATAQHLSDLASGLVKAGHEVTVLAGQRGYADPNRLFPSREIDQGIRIVRVWPHSFGRKTHAARILDTFFLNLSFAWKIFWLGRFDAVVAMTSPAFVACSAAFFARLHASGFYYWVMDINPDEAIEAGWLRRDSLRARCFEAALKFILSHARATIVLDRFMKDRLVLKGADPEKFFVISPWAHDEDLETIPHEKNPFRQQHTLNGKFVVMYSGNFSLCHPLDTLLHAAALLKDDPSVVFLFIGDGERLEDILAAQKNGLRNVVRLPYQTRADLKYSLSAADLQTVVMGASFVGIVHPSKIYGILGIGRPFVYIGPPQSPIGEIVSHFELGYQVPHGAAGRLVEVIEEVKGLDERTRKGLQEREQDLVKKQFSKNSVTQKLIEIFLATPPQ